MGLVEDFNAAAEAIKPVDGVSTENMLKLYGLYKQSTVGDNTTGKPGILDMKGRKKWDFWTENKGMSQEDAMKAYIELVNKILVEKGLQPVGGEPQPA